MYVLFVHAGISVCLIVVGAILTGLGSITQDTYLAMVSGAVGLLSGGGTALALQNQIKRTAE